MSPERRFVIFDPPGPYGPAISGGVYGLVVFLLALSLAGVFYAAGFGDSRLLAHALSLGVGFGAGVWWTFESLVAASYPVPQNAPPEARK